MFNIFKKKLQKHVAEMLQQQQTLFVTDTDKDKLWEIYLESFPTGTNEIFRERREHDCSCCRHFIKSFGNVVVINDNKLMSIWDFNACSITYQPVIDALSVYVKSKCISNVFITKEAAFGTDHNFEQSENGRVYQWDHFRIELPSQFVSTSNLTVDTLKGSFRDIMNVFKRSLEEISKDSIETVLDLISQKSLYKGDEWKNVLEQFLSLHVNYNKLEETLNFAKKIFCWVQSVKVGGAIGKIRNHSIGVLLQDITKGMDLNEAVKRYEKIVAPTNYKRPKAIFTKKMVEQAQKTITEFGLLNSLGRRFAVIDDITINNILFANKDTAKKITNDVFEDLKKDAVINLKKFDKIEEVTINDFIKKILPTVTNIELLLENHHVPNFVSVIAPKNKNSKSMFKWNNNFSWGYNGNIADSMMKERVKMAGGNVEGVLRFSIQWNDGDNNQNDFDAHALEPNGNLIFYLKKAIVQPSSGMLDVDIIHPRSKIAVENITWTDINKMPEGRYTFLVHCFSHNGGRTGFTAEIEYEGQIYSYTYDKELREDEKVIVAKFNFSKENGVQFINSLPSPISSKTIWNLNINQFHPVSVCMFSPNYWDEQKGIGHKHYFFIMNQCKNPDRLKGFFNEFLREDLMEHKRVFEALGSKMRVELSDNQLSGLGFSSTQRNSIVCKLEGNFTRTIKVIF